MECLVDRHRGKHAPALHYPRFRHALPFANNIIYYFRPGRPLLYPTFSDGGRIPESAIITIRDTARRYTFQIEWRDNDLLMFDNTRFMHGRRAIVDRQRTIWTQFSDAGFQ
jgi:Taurine catabolism dioxygenase TauD, TfdA family